VAPAGVVGCGGPGVGATTGLATGTTGGGGGGLAARAGATGGKEVDAGAFGGAVGATGGFIATVTTAALEGGAGDAGGGSGLGAEAGRAWSFSAGAASATGAPHCSQNSLPKSSGPLQKRQAIVPGGSGGFWNRSTASFSSIGSALVEPGEREPSGSDSAGLMAGAPAGAGVAAEPGEAAIGTAVPQFGQKRIPAVTFVLHLGHEAMTTVSPLDSVLQPTAANHITWAYRFQAAFADVPCCGFFQM
jgi:hypothetical protein